MSVQPPILLDTGQPLVTSTVTVTLPVDDVPTAEIVMPDGIKMHDFVEIFTAQGSAGIFRVTDRSATFGDMIQLRLRGALDTLSDDLWPGQDSITGTIPDVIEDILEHQSTARWQLGTCARNSTVKISNSYTNLLDLLAAVKSEAQGCRWVYDFSTTPWTLSLAEMDPTVVAEFRVGRNVESAVIDMSDADMCTRLYMSVSTDSSSQIYTFDNQAAQAEWGVICKTADVKAENAPDPQAYGQAILAERSQPIAFITIDGYDLHRLTGDAFDQITLGSHCRVTLEGYATAFEEVVTQITWPDALGEPDRISVNLANNMVPFAEQLKIIKASGGGAAKKVEEQERELVRHQADISKSNERILLWATEEQWDEIAEEYETTHLTELTVMYNQISLKVSAGDVATQLAIEVGNVTITGGNLVVDGYVTATAFDGLEAEFDNLTTGVTEASWLKANLLTVSGSLAVGANGSFLLGGVGCHVMSQNVVTGATITMPQCNMSAVHNFGYVNASGTYVGMETGRVITSYVNGSVDVNVSPLYYVGYTPASS